MSNGLWGELPTGTDIKAPSAILNEQISELQKGTNGLLLGYLKARQNNADLINEFYIVAPALNNYAVKVLQITHGIELYPCTIWASLLNTSPVRVASEKEFIENLGLILKNEKTRAIIAGLLAQTRAQS